MKTPAIKPCPFCGGEARFIEGGDRWYIQCMSGIIDAKPICRASIVHHTPDRFPKGTFVKGNWDKTWKNMAKWAFKKLLLKWNKRKTA